MTSARRRPARVLLVEDNPADVRLTRELLEGGDFPPVLEVARDGVEALESLRGGSPGGLPEIVLLDLNLPRRSGLEVLADIKADPALRRIPVVILTTSQADGDLRRAYELHANAYVTKPRDLPGFARALRAFESFWLRTITLPDAAGRP